MAGHTFSTGNTDGTEHKALCEVCKIQQKHKVEVSARSKWESDDYNGITEFEIIRCLNCDAVSFRKESSNSEDYYYDHESEEYTADYDVAL